MTKSPFIEFIDTFDSSFLVNKTQVKQRLTYRLFDRTMISLAFGMLAEPGNTCPFAVIFDTEIGGVAVLTDQGADSYDVYWKFGDNDTAFEFLADRWPNVLIK